MAVLVPGQPPLQRKVHQRLDELTEAEVVRLWGGGEAEHHHQDQRDDDKE